MGGGGYHSTVLCAMCCLELYDETQPALCPHHTADVDGERWADGNRAICDFIHRGRALPRLEAIHRDEPVWTSGTCE